MILAIEIAGIWSLIAIIIGLIAGAVIRKGERLHKEEVLVALFAAISNLQAAR